MRDYEFCGKCPAPGHGFDFCPWRAGTHRHAHEVVCGFLESGRSEWEAETVRQAQRDSGMDDDFGKARPNPRMPAILRRKEPGTIRLALCVPHLKTGGAEKWTEAIFDALQGDGYEWVGMGVLSQGDHPLRPPADSMQVFHGERGIRHLAPHADVLISWGIPGIVRMTAHSAARKILVAHGIGPFDVACLAEAKYADGLVGVSAVARHAFPASERSRVKVIGNAVRLRESDIPVAHVRDRLGIPDGMKILGYLGRMAPEKYPELFVDVVGKLPEDWIGVMAGPDQMGMDDYIARQGLQDRVRAIGEVSEVESIVPAFRSLLVPSLIEGDCLAAKEAIWLGVPVLMRQTGFAWRNPDFVRVISGEDAAMIAGLVLRDDESGEGRTRAEWAARSARHRWGMEPFTRSWRELVDRISEGKAVKNIYAELLSRIESCPARGPKPEGAGCGCAASCALLKGDPPFPDRVSIRRCQDCIIEIDRKNDEKFVSSPVLKSDFDRAYQSGFRPVMPSACIREGEPITASKVSDGLKVIRNAFGVAEGGNGLVLPPENKIRVGFVCPVFMPTGGTETFHKTLVPQLAKDPRFDIVGMAVEDVTRFDHHADVGCMKYTGMQGVNYVADHSDVLIMWGMFGLERFVRSDQYAVMTSHGDDGSQFTCDVMRRAEKWADRYVAVNKAALRPIPESRRSDAVVIDNAVDLMRLKPRWASRSEFRSSIGVGPSEVMVLFTARHSEEKNPLKAVEVARKLPENYVMVMAGEGKLLGDVRLAASTVPRCRVLGVRHDQADLLEAADVFLSLSRTEGFGLAVAEAMAVDVSVVSTKKGFLEEHPEFAWIIKDDESPDSIARAIQSTYDFSNLACDRGMWIRSAGEFVRRKYSVEAHVKAWSDFIVECAARRNQVGQAEKNGGV